MNSPVLSIVVTVVDGGDALRRCLHALSTQVGAPAMQVLVPYDSTIASVPAIVREFAALDPTAIDLGKVSTHRSPRTAGGQHELIDRRRAAGLAASSGALIAILEDRGVPRPDWAGAAVRLHNEAPNLVIGGAVENGRDRLWHWAVYCCDFGRYQLPFAAGPRRFISDVNVVYKRRALELSREVWRDRFHEPLVHAALERAGETLWLSPDLVIDEVRDDVTWTGLMAERLAWGRLFGALRVADASPARRITYVAAAPLVPVVLVARILRGQWRTGVTTRRLVMLTPAVFLLSCAWAAGEAGGSITGRA